MNHQTGRGLGLALMAVSILVPAYPMGIVLTIIGGAIYLLAIDQEVDR